MEQNEGMTIPGEGGEITITGPEVDPAIHDKARAQGWVPKEEFRGDPNRWIDAKQFVERGENILPILKERNEHLTKEIGEVKKSVTELTNFYKNAEDRAYKRALQDIEARRIAAVETGDVAGFQAVEKERADLEQAKPSAAPAGKPADSPEMAAFRANNVWYDADPELTAEADALGIVYAKQGMPYKQVLDRVQERIKAIHPDKFSNARRDGAAAVEGVDTSTGLPRKAGARTYENLPAEARSQCDKWVKQGLLTKDDYLRDYEWE